MFLCFHSVSLSSDRLSYLNGLILSRLEHLRSLLHMTLIGTTSELVCVSLSLFASHTKVFMHDITHKCICSVLVYCGYIFLTQFCALASMARKIYLRGGLGVGAFRRIYGGSKRNGSRPPHFCKSSGSIARHILQQLQTMKIIEIEPKG